MPFPAPAGLLRKAVGTVVTGVVGVTVVRAAERRSSTAGRRVAVEITKAGLRGARAVEVGVERARLSAGDVVAQARGEMGEQAPPPSGSVPHSHDHDH